MESFLALMGLTWEGAINLGLWLVEAGKRLAIKEGVPADKLDALEAAAVARLRQAGDKLLDEWKAIVKP